MLLLFCSSARTLSLRKLEGWLRGDRHGLGVPHGDDLDRRAESMLAGGGLGKLGVRLAWPGRVFCSGLLSTHRVPRSAILLCGSHCGQVPPFPGSLSHLCSHRVVSSTSLLPSGLLSMLRYLLPQPNVFLRITDPTWVKEGERESVVPWVSGALAAFEFFSEVI